MNAGITQFLVEYRFPKPIGRIVAFVVGPVDVGQFLTTKSGGGLQWKRKGTTNSIALEAVPNGQTRKIEKYGFG